MLHMPYDGPFPARLGTSALLATFPRIPAALPLQVKLAKEVVERNSRGAPTHDIPAPLNTLASEAARCHQQTLWWQRQPVSAEHPAMHPAGISANFAVLHDKLSVTVCQGKIVARVYVCWHVLP
jgi:hypothetical protein